MTHPAPEIPCRLATDDEIPGGARTIKNFAERNGWHVTVTFARGTRLGRVPRVVNSVVLRMARGKDQAVAAWQDKSFDCAYVWSLDPGSTTPRKVQIRELRAHLI